jgi:hypothetical protein
MSCLSSRLGGTNEWAFKRAWREMHKRGINEMVHKWAWRDGVD